MKSILLCVTLGTRKSLMTLIFSWLISFSDTQTSCNKQCKFGNPVSDADGNCRCQCVLRYRGEICDAIPDCGSKSCGFRRGHLRGDCKCICAASYTGERCQTFRCPYKNHTRCSGLNNRNCYSPLNQRQCPYLCNGCQESQRPKLKSGKYLHISQYGCIFEGIRPSKEMCKTLGNNGDDKMSCFDVSDVDTNCGRCKNGFSRHALVNCPVMCALCDKPDNNSTIESGTETGTTTASVTRNSTTTVSLTETSTITASMTKTSPTTVSMTETSTTTASMTKTSTTTAYVTSTSTAEQDTGMTSLIRHLTRAPKTQRSSQGLESGEIAGVVVGVVMIVVLVSVVVIVLIRRCPFSKNKKKSANPLQGDFSELSSENVADVNCNEHYVSLDIVEDETNSRYEMISIDNSDNRPNIKEPEYDHTTVNPSINAFEKYTQFSHTPEITPNANIEQEEQTAIETNPIKSTMNMADNLYFTLEKENQCESYNSNKSPINEFERYTQTAHASELRPNTIGEQKEETAIETNPPYSTAKMADNLYFTLENENQSIGYNSDEC